MKHHSSTTNNDNTDVSLAARGNNEENHLTIDELSEEEADLLTNDNSYSPNLDNSFDAQTLKSAMLLDQEFDSQNNDESCGRDEDDTHLLTMSEHSSDEEASLMDDQPDKMLIPKFSTKESQRYFAQDIDLLVNHGIKHGGFRGLCWCARNHHKLFRSNNISTVSDSNLMLYFTLLLY